jgi:hypothetical protein
MVESIASDLSAGSLLHDGTSWRSSRFRSCGEGGVRALTEIESVLIDIRRDHLVTHCAIRLV